MDTFLSFVFPLFFNFAAVRNHTGWGTRILTKNAFFSLLFSYLSLPRLRFSLSFTQKPLLAVFLYFDSSLAVYITKEMLFVPVPLPCNFIKMIYHSQLRTLVSHVSSQHRKSHDVFLTVLIKNVHTGLVMLSVEKVHFRS